MNPLSHRSSLLSPPFRYAYLHGFGSSPGSRKGVYLARAFEAEGLELERPDLNVPAFSDITYSAALATLDNLDAVSADAPPWRLIGSSMGGYLAARWAELRPDRVDRLVLLCPGFGLTDRWPELLGAEDFARWEKKGFHVFPDALGRLTPVSWKLISDAQGHPSCPEICCATLIIHGRQDEVVPVEGSRLYVRSRPHIRLVEVDDGHDLAASLDLIEDLALQFLSPRPGRTVEVD